MSHKSRIRKKKFECGHEGLGKFCHRCAEEKAGRLQAKRRSTTEEGAGGGGSAPAAEAPKKFWNRAKCPHCGGSRVKKNDLNVFSDMKAFEYTCTSYECGKSFNSDQVKEYEQVEAKPRTDRR